MSELTDTPLAATEGLAGKYLTFALQGESYGIGVLRVREISRMARLSLPAGNGDRRFIPMDDDFKDF